MDVFLHQPTPLYCDSQSVIQIASNSVFHEQVKDIDIDCHVIRHHYQLGTITLPFISSFIQIAGMFIKALSASRFHLLVGKLSILLAIAS